MAEPTDLTLKITADVGSVDTALNKLEKDVKSAGNTASVSLSKVETLLESINAAAQSAAGSLGKPFTQAAPEVDKYRANIQKLEKQVSSLQAQLDKLAKTPAPKAPEGPDVNALRAKYDPLFAISQKYKDTLAEIALAEKAGALTAATASNARKDAANAANLQMTATTKLTSVMSKANGEIGLTSNQLLNLSRQGNDALTMLASGSSVFQVFATQAGQTFSALEEGPQGLKGSLESIKQYAIGAATAIGPIGLAFGGITIAAIGLAQVLKRDVEPTEDIIKRQAASVKALTEEYNLVAPAAEAAGRRSRAAMDFEVGAQTKKDLFNLQRMAFDMQDLPGVNALYNQRSRSFTQAEPIRKALKDLQDTARAGVPDFVAYRDALTKVIQSDTPENLKETAKFLLENSEEGEKARRSFLGIADALDEVRTKSNEAKQRLSELQKEVAGYNPDGRSDAQKIQDNYAKQIAAINKIVADNPRTINGLIETANQQANAALDKLSEDAKKKQAETAESLANVGLGPLEKQIAETTQRYNREIEEYKRTKGDAVGVAALEAAKLNDLTRIRKEAGIAATEEADKVRKAADERLAAISETTDRLKAQVDTFGMSEGAAAAYEYRLQALSDAQRAVGEGKVIPENERQAIEAAAASVEDYTNQLRALNEQKRQSERLAAFEDDLNFKTQIRGLNQEDQQIAERLRSVGVDYLSIQGQQYAAQMKYNDALKKTNDGIIDFQDLGESAFDVLNDSLREGTGLLGGLMNMFGKLANQLASQAFGKLFGGLFNPGQATGVGSGNSFFPQSTNSAPTQNNANSLVNTLQQGVVPAFKNASTSMTAAAKAIRTIESGSAAGNYSAIGPATRTGDRALGAYQMMGANLPQWSRDAIGREVGKVEFLRSVELQDKIFEHRFGSYMKKYGPEGASRAWFAGEGGMKNWNAKDVVGTSVNGYGSRFGSLYGKYNGDNSLNTTSSIDQSRALKAGVSEGVIDAQRRISTGQAGAGLQPSTVTAWTSNGDMRTVGSRINTGGAGAAPSGWNGMTGAGSILGVQYPEFSALGGLSAGLGGFSSGYSSGSPLSGGLTGGLSGFMSGGPIGGLIGLGSGILGGIFGGKAQRKQKHQEAAAKWEEMRPQYEAFDRSLSGEKSGDLRKYVTDGWGQLSSFMQTGGAAWKMGSGNSTAQFNSTGKKLFDGFNKMLKEFQDGFDDMVDDLASGQGLEGSFAKGRNAAKALSEQVKKTQDDIDIAFGNVGSIDFLNTSAAQEQAKNTEKARAEALERFNKAAGEYALSLLYTERTVSEVEKTVDGLRGTAAGLQGVLEDLGWSADEAAKAIGERLNQALANMRSEFEKGIADRIDDLNGKGYFAETREMIKEFKQLQQDASILGADQTNFAELFRLQSQSIVDGSELTGDAFAELIRKFPELEGVVKEFSSAALKATASEIKSAIESYDERLFAAKNANDELVLFDHKAAQERIEAAKYGTEALAKLEQALAAERANAALTIARSNLDRSYQAETTRINKLLTERQKEASELETSISSLESYTKSLESFRKSMLTDENVSTLSPYQRFLEAQQQFRDTASKAAAGDEDAQAELANASQRYLEESRSYYASSEEYYRSFEEVRKLIGEQEKTAGKALSANQQQLKALESQIEQGQKELELLEKQNEAITGLNAGVMALSVALSAFVSAALATRPGANTTPESKAPASDRTTQYLINNPDVLRGIQAGQTFGLSEGASIDDIVKAHWNLHGKNELADGRVAYAGGGLVTGPGTGTSDSIMAKLSNGEFVTRAASVNTQTRGMLDFINRNGVVPNANDNSRMEGVERRLDNLTRTVAAGFQLNNETGMEGNKIASQTVENMKLANSR